MSGSCAPLLSGSPLQSPARQQVMGPAFGHNASGKRTRHVNIRFHRVRDAIRGKRIAVTYVRGGSSIDSEQQADIMTKSCSGPLFDKFDRAIRGIRNG